ncbi:MAG TPA: HAMP domain-containing sensor histidine kinase, partial [Christiangramia sp.]|nr:HAMP domain-containing sensor histidine kinase [Christiangramia sp.]
MSNSQTHSEQKKKSRGNKYLNSSEKEAANEHGEQRLKFGFDFIQLSSEFRALRASILRLWGEKSHAENWKTDFHDMIRFNEAVDEVWALSVKGFQEKLDESRNLFLGILGHDLRNPISTIKGVNSILKHSKDLSEKERKMILHSDLSVNRMNELIGNLLELTELRLGNGMTINKSEFDLTDLFRNITFEQKLAFPNTKFNLEIDGANEGRWDELRLSQMMSNLIANAVKHGAEDGIISLELFGTEEHSIISIHNNGPHISEDILDKIFDGRFSVSNGGSAEEKSYGLGLLIVKEIVESHDGKIKVLSNPEDGTTFKITLPKKLKYSELAE